MTNVQLLAEQSADDVSDEHVAAEHVVTVSKKDSDSMQNGKYWLHVLMSRLLQGTVQVR